jgi:hypothetical protein
MFGFNVLSVEKLLCCSDSPGEPQPDCLGSACWVVVEGTTKDNWRFLLDCPPPFTVVKTKSGYVTRWGKRDEWFELHTASIEHGNDGDMMTIYTTTLDPNSKWTKWTTCTIVNRIDHAKDVAPMRVVSSALHQWEDGPGYDITAYDARETYKLSCVKGSQSPCESVAPGNYWRVRDGSEVRICDGQLNVVCTCEIRRERGYR